MDEALTSLLLFVILPLWLAAGTADWLCHRASSIEHTSGLSESRVHGVMHLQLVAALAAVAVLHVNAGVLLLCAALAGTHLVTSWADTRRASAHRRILPIEQHVHSFLDALPLFSVVLLGLLEWDQLRDADGAMEWSLRFKTVPWPSSDRWIWFGLLALSFVPIVEEYRRCREARSEKCQTPTSTG